MAKERTDDKGEPAQDWDILPGEPSLWYSRFCRYREAGAKRRFLAVYNAERAHDKKPSAKVIPSSWTVQIKKWKWAERAKAWDVSLEKTKENTILDDLRWLTNLKRNFGKAVAVTGMEMLSAPRWQDRTETVDGETRPVLDANGKVIRDPLGWGIKDSVMMFDAGTRIMTAGLLESPEQMSQQVKQVQKQMEDAVAHKTPAEDMDLLREIAGIATTEDGQVADADTIPDDQPDEADSETI